MNRLPSDKATTSGADIKNPKRFKDRQKPKRTRPIGEPYATMDELECKYWNEFVQDMGWLNSTHRVLLKTTCRLAAQMDTKEEFGVSKIQALSSLLSKLGATPVDETKVNHGNGDDEEDETEQYFH